MKESNILNTNQQIAAKSRSLFALHGYEGFTMRTLARDCDISLSSIYHHFKDKDELLHAQFNAINTELGQKRARLPEPSTASEALRQRIEFQFENSESILFVLKYYLHFRDRFKKQPVGYLEDKAYLHITEVLDRGVRSGEFTITTSTDEEAKVIAHSINGFVLEYFPKKPDTDEYIKMVDSIHSFLVRSLTNKAEMPS